MEISQWDERYRCGDRAKEDLEVAPNPLLVETAAKLRPGRALDLACGTGRNAIWLAEHGWRVTAVDGAATAIEILRGRARDRRARVDTQLANLESNQYRIEADSWDLIAICFYLHKPLFDNAKRGLRPGGVVVVIVHVAPDNQAATEHQLQPGELGRYFVGWEILHCFEGKPNDPAHKREVAEIVARRPQGSKVRG